MRLLLATLAFALATGPAALGQIPTPRPKPQVSEVPPGRTISIPIPRAKPELKETSTLSSAAEPAHQWPPDLGRWRAPDVSEARAECSALLEDLDIIWRPSPPIGSSGGCGTAAPIAVSEIAHIRINPPAITNCRMAAALHSWFTQSLQPAARQELHTTLVEVRNASSYACRRRNNARSGKLSEHGKANAFDISEFVFAKNAVVSVEGNWSGFLQTVGFSSRGSFLKRVRKDSCAYFNTVLGPGSDRFHKNHFHVDLMPLRPGRFKMCH